MQLTNIFTVLALAMTAAALPAVEVLEARTNPPVSQCNSNQNAVCCNLGVLSLLGLNICSIGVLDILTGGNCNSNSYCCNTGNQQAGIINLNLLNCAKLL